VPADKVEQPLRDIFKEVTDKGPGGHILTGPIFVEGAEPGDTLEVRIQDVKLAIPYSYVAFGPENGPAPAQRCDQTSICRRRCWFPGPARTGRSAG